MVAVVIFLLACAVKTGLNSISYGVAHFCELRRKKNRPNGRSKFAVFHLFVVILQLTASGEHIIGNITASLSSNGRKKADHKAGEMNQTLSHTTSANPSAYVV